MRLFLPPVRHLSVASTLFVTGGLFTSTAQAQTQLAQATLTGASSLAVLEIKGKQVTLSAGADEGVKVGSIYTLMRNGQTSAQLRISQVLATQSVAQLVSEQENAPLVVGDTVGFVGLDTTILTSPAPLAANPVVPTPSGPLTPIVPAPVAPTQPLTPAPPTAVGAPVVPPAPVQTPVATSAQPSSKSKDGFKLIAASGLIQSVNSDGSVTLSIGSQAGVRADDELTVLRSGAAIGTVKVASTEETRSTGQFTARVAGTLAQAGDLVQQGGAKESRRVESRRRNTSADFIGALAAAVAVLATDKDTASSDRKEFIGTQQYSVISPFPGGGYSILPSGKIDPGGAMQVNIPVAYTPHRLTGVIGGYAAQNRAGTTLGNEDDRNGTANLGLGFGLNGRGAWVSRMILSKVGLNGGDRAYNVQYQITEETSKLPAISAGVQDFTNARIFSPFVVATKQLLSTERPVFLSLGVGKGRFSGDSVFGGVSFVPVRRLSLAAEYDGLQINLGASLALTRRLTLMASYNDLNETTDRITGSLGKRYQVGGSIRF